MSKATAYIEFLKSKNQLTTGAGLKPVEMHPSLFGHQRDVVAWALQRGKALIAAKFGMGKTRMQIEIMRQVHAHTGRRVLVICPLGVKHQFIHEDGPAMDVRFAYIGNDEQGMAADTPYLITNYERVRDGQITEGFLQSEIAGVCLDEGAILGNLGTKTQQEFSRILSAIPYRWVATATPAPNDYRQLIYFADFLDAMDAGQSLTRWFGRNPDKAGDLQLLPHMEKEFWLWIASWALFVDTPSDLGYDDTGYDMPELNIIFHRLTADHLAAQNLTDQFGQHYLLADTAAGVQQAMKEKRSSLQARIDKAAEIVADAPNDHYVIWHDLEDERKAICKAIKSAKAVYGSQDSDEAERLVLQFAHGEMPIIAAKPSMFGSGVNWQHYCHKAIYAGVGFKFRDFIQSLHRLQRYGQQHTVEVHLIHTDAEDHVVDILMKKWKQHDEMVAKMRQIIKEFGLTNEALNTGMQRSLGVNRQATKGEWFTAINNDTVLETMAMPDNSVDEIVTSIPFGNHYEYVASLNDFGHNQADSDFWEQMDYLIPELLRVLKPGRMACIHVKDRLLYGHQTPHGMMEVDYFTHDCARAFKKHGFVSYGEIFIPTDVVRENNSTNRLGWSECCKDGSKMGVGLSEKVLLFRKPQTDKTRSYADEPVRKDKKAYSRGRWQIDAHSLWRSNGKAIDDVAHVTPAEDPSLLIGMDGSQVYNWYREWSKGAPYDYHQHVAFNEAMGERLPAKFMLMSPQAPDEYEETVWTDVLFMRTLNMNQARRRVEKHVCLARGSLILTRNGYKPIEDVSVFDMVLTHKGRWRPVIAVQNTGVRPVVNLRAQGVANLILTPDHKVWMRKSDWVRERDGAERTDPDWVKAEDALGGYVNLKLPSVEPTELTKQELWLLGRWLADGHVGARGEYVVSIGHEKLAEFEHMADGHVGTKAERTAMQVRLKKLSHSLRDALATCGKGAENKQLPPFAVSLPADDASALLEGYLSGDGHYLESRQRWMATSASRKLLLGLAMLVQRVYGTIACVHHGRPEGTTIIEGRQVNTKQEWIMSFDLTKGRRVKPFILEDGAWKKVKSVDDAGEVETWNLRVAEDESYTAEGCVVKNCPLPLDIVERLIVRYSNPDEVIFDPFAGLFTVPYMAVKLGRRGWGNELNPLYWENGVKYCRDAEMQRSMPTLFDDVEPTEDVYELDEVAA